MSSGAGVSLNCCLDDVPWVRANRGARDLSEAKAISRKTISAGGLAIAKGTACNRLYELRPTICQRC